MNKVATAKDIVLRPIDSKTARETVRRLHYSGKVVNNSQLHIGVYLAGRLEGAMQFGPSLDKRKLQGLVAGTGWNEFIELNRLAFSDALPRNSESRAIGVAMKILKKHAPHVKWVVSFADACQCGDGTIYRASGFVLTGIKKNDQIWAHPDHDETFTRMSLSAQGSKGNASDKLRAISRVTATKGAHMENGSASMQKYKDLGYVPLSGYQLRYIYFIDRKCRDRLTVEELPYSRIQEMGAAMYKGKPVTRA